MNTSFPSRRPPADRRTFSSPACEHLIEEVAPAIVDDELRWLFTNCLPNTLDTTISFSRDADGLPDTYVITGDIDAMWLRDSAAQVWPYLPLANEHADIRDLIAGVVRRQTACILLDPYANAFYREPRLGEWRNDGTRMVPGVHERKWELDSPCYFLRLSHGYWRATGDLLPFDNRWREAVRAVLRLLRVEQGGVPGRSTYGFTRPGSTDSLLNGGIGDPARPCGLVRSAFRPSDDLCKLPYHVPSNAMASVVLRDVAELLDLQGETADADEARTISREIAAALEAHAVVRRPEIGEIWAYEVDGYGSAFLMDDANIPSLLALPYLGFCAKTDPRYLRTRAFCLSEANPYFFRGAAGEGIGGPHAGLRTIWPLAILMRALTAVEDNETLACLRQLRATHAGTGFMHETFTADDAARFTRSWFAWANTLFGELIVTLYHERPHLLTHPL
jgi:meiotically up-regulated gene 157 (Mug157) protein